MVKNARQTNSYTVKLKFKLYLLFMKIASLWVGGHPEIHCYCLRVYSTDGWWLNKFHHAAKREKKGEPHSKPVSQRALPINLKQETLFGFGVSLFYSPDNNECEFDNGGCDQICENLPGSFRCNCHPGYSYEWYIPFHFWTAHRKCLRKSVCTMNVTLVF